MSSTSPSQFFAAPAAAANTMMHPKTLEPYDGAGPSVTPHNNMQPFLVLTPAIATIGVFPQFT
jgi:microcystin-dependent protein